MGINIAWITTVYQLYVVFSYKYNSTIQQLQFSIYK